MLTVAGGRVTAEWELRPQLFSWWVRPDLGCSLQMPVGAFMTVRDADEAETRSAGTLGVLRRLV